MGRSVEHPTVADYRNPSGTVSNSLCNWTVTEGVCHTQNNKDATEAELDT
jgi:hypothetical protein